MAEFELLLIHNVIVIRFYVDRQWKKQGVYKGVRVKYAYGGSAAGCLYLICIVVSGPSKDELKKDEFMVVNIEGLSSNDHIDPRNKEVGYMCLVGKNVAHTYFSK